MFLFLHLPQLEFCFIANMKPYLWLSLSPQLHVHIYNESAEVVHIPAKAAYDYKEDVNITALLDSEAFCTEWQRCLPFFLDLALIP